MRCARAEAEVGPARISFLGAQCGQRIATSSRCLAFAGVWSVHKGTDSGTILGRRRAGRGGPHERVILKT